MVYDLAAMEADLAAQKEFPPWVRRVFGLIRRCGGASASAMLSASESAVVEDSRWVAAIVLCEIYELSQWHAAHLLLMDPHSVGRARLGWQARWACRPEFGELLKGVVEGLRDEVG